jgi:hypothetical protein
MNSKTLVFIGMSLGGVLGGYIPMLWGADFLSYSAVLFSGLGSIFGIWVGYKLSS